MYSVLFREYWSNFCRHRIEKEKQQNRDVSRLLVSSVIELIEVYQIAAEQRESKGYQLHFS